MNPLAFIGLIVVGVVILGVLIEIGDRTYDWTNNLIDRIERRRAHRLRDPHDDTTGGA